MSTVDLKLLGFDAFSDQVCGTSITKTFGVKRQSTLHYYSYKVLTTPRVQINRIILESKLKYRLHFCGLLGLCFYLER
jgi:hypothetical protein